MVRNGCGIWIYSFFIPLSLSYIFHLLLQLFTASISTLSHVSFFFSFSYSLPPSPLSHTLSSSLSPFVRSLLSVLSLMLPIRYSLFLRVTDSRISKLPISSLFYLRVCRFVVRCSQSRRNPLYHRRFAILASHHLVMIWDLGLLNFLLHGFPKEFLTFLSSNSFDGFKLIRYAKTQIWRELGNEFF